MALVYEKQTGILQRCFFDVQNEVGAGRQERAYQNGCELWMEEHGVPFSAQPSHHLLLHGQIAHTLRPDFVCWDKITVELKAVRRRLHDPDFVQLFDYLKCRGDRVGMLVNMGLDRVKPERRLWDSVQHDLAEDWSYWSGAISGSDREVGVEVRGALQTLFSAHGTGYGEEVMGDLLTFELRRRGLSFVEAPVSKAYYHGQEVDEAPLDCAIIEGRMLLTFTALFEENDFNISRGVSYLKALGLEWGIAANFGKKAAQFAGLHVRS